ncbi:hypothetical protein CkaCkLH20_07303 [Colletotrichum karsti]|uniref:Leucine Rich Repeat family protein n=1 Tax=Colletotrichum karsti TaxID=1095194 RepID=A0A9P6I141_9PEZI|nr:uncharacterized protein CkaCkLH20_07303 [Colletotrichum karsti]KAF9875037.1 hypothetical protein CkaCkLH20_07303 [Colletotrichum karsti]
MADEPALPRLLPSITWNAQTERFSNNPKKRRYHLRNPSTGPASYSNSSDPAVFSSDDDPGLDNYVEGRRKKRYVGAWYEQQPVASSDSATGEPRPALRGKRRAFRRDMDSGVFMGSDSTDGDESIMMPDIPTQARLPQLNIMPPTPRRRNDVSAMEQEAREKIRTFMDEGDESIDLSNMGLKTLSDATIRLLSEFICIPVVAEGVPFEHKDPDLKLYLYRNPLLRVPGAIFDLEHVTVLSLRGCRLRELPPAIGKMRKLRTLNLAQNLLRCLPAEVLDLMTSSSALGELLLQGNQFFRTTDLPRLSDLGDFGADGSVEKELFESGTLASNGIAARYFARSPVQYMDTRRVTWSEFVLDPEAVVVPTERHESAENSSLVTPPCSAPSQSKAAGRSTLDARGSRVPSLMEKALRSAYGSSDLSELPEYLPPQLDHLSRLLEHAANVKAAGGTVCFACKKPFVVPTAQWLEWWQVCTVEKTQRDGENFLKARPWTDLLEENDGAVPFLRRGCSWKCCPADIAEGKWSTQ